MIKTTHFNLSNWPLHAQFRTYVPLSPYIFLFIFEQKLDVVSPLNEDGNEQLAELSPILDSSNQQQP